MRNDPQNCMRAARLHRRGGPEAIVIDEIPVPEPAEGEVRVRVRAAAITPGELGWDQTYQNADGSPRIPTIPCHDVAGVVDKLGARVHEVVRGTLVYALIDFPLHGSAAEFAIVRAADIAPAPRTIDAIHAAAVPLSALTAWQALFEHGELQAGQRVLIHGAAGGVGAFAVQLAKWRGAKILTTTSPKNIDAMRELGVDTIIDYTATRFEDVCDKVDLVFDTVGGDTLARSIPVIRKGGALISIAGKPDAARCAAAGIRGVFFIVRPNRSQLEQITTLIDEGELRVHVQDVYPLTDAAQAFARSVGGHLSGKVILRID